MHLLGILIEKIAYRPLRNATRISVDYCHWSFLVLEYGMMFFVSANVRTYPEMTGIMAKTMNMGSLVISMQQIILVSITIALMILLQFIVKQPR